MNLTSKTTCRRSSAFTLIELALVVAVLAALAGLMLPALGRAKTKAGSMACLNNMHQLGMAHLLYADENHGRFPERRDDKRWPTQLRPGYRTIGTLRCPEDRRASTAGQRVLAENEPDTAVRSYIINGWNDYFRETLKITGVAQMVGRSVPEEAVGLPTVTIIFGEKATNSSSFYMDFLENGKDVTDLVRNRHMTTSAGNLSKRNDGGSNYAFADGHSEFIRYRGMLYPLNLWAVTAGLRTSRELSN